MEELKLPAMFCRPTLLALIVADVDNDLEENEEWQAPKLIMRQDAWELLVELVGPAQAEVDLAWAKKACWGE